MDKLKLTYILLFSCFLIFSSSAQNQNREEITRQIDSLLRSAELSVNRYEFDKAKNELNRSLELAKDSNHKRYVALSSSISSKLDYIRHNYSDATTSLNRAIAIQREIMDETGLAYSYLSFSKILISQQERQRAIDYLNLSESHYKNSKEKNLQDYLALLNLQRAILFLNLDEQPNKAFLYLKEARKNLDSLSNPYEYARLHYYLAKTELSRNNFDAAIRSANISLAISEQHEFNGMIMSCYEILSQIYEYKGDSLEALQYLKLSNIERDNIFDINKKALAQDHYSKYGRDALKSEIKELSAQKEENERSLKVNKLTTILSVALITILSLLTLSLYKNNNLRARANGLLQKKNRELTLAKENAERATTAKAQFLSTITHELRTPLYAVTGLTHLLLEENPTPNQKEHLNSLKFSGEYLLSLINNILDLNKLEANKVEIINSSFDLKKRISDVLIALKNSADDKNNKIHFDFEKTIPNRLKGDPLKLSQILINLIGNSIKFTEDGNIWIKVGLLKQFKDEVLLHFEIEDNGEGISKEKQKAIFENFTQGSTQINRKFGGTGLGLSIVKNLLSLMESEISLESDLGKGSKFSFDLKFGIVEPALNTEEQQEEKPATKQDYLEGKEILVVEDNKINQMITKKIIEKNKAICRVADNGSTAIEMVREGSFNLILMDIHMPGISGIEATKEIRKFNTEIPIIALTAVTLDENLDEFYLNGFNDIIPKPYKTEEFFAKINKYLAKQETKT
ncbi:ATP-binding protein [Zunongwangia profunda]|uniref:tetratricopeptide repeat-containing hybrid sensor histidine kinase/response regulator n=1 Tax=Zunongwangia profunda TaxID=398743 RepID=UPI000C8E3624|nr:hybrid sensor histidine kinase/response regulator [Flavobacteriaceae bacterium]